MPICLSSSGRGTKLRRKTFNLDENDDDNGDSNDDDNGDDNDDDRSDS